MLSIVIKIDFQIYNFILISPHNFQFVLFWPKLQIIPHSFSFFFLMNLCGQKLGYDNF